MSNVLRPHGLQHARLSCPSPSPRACSNSCPLSQWCHSAISSSVIPFFLPSVFPSIRVFCNESALCIKGHSQGNKKTHTLGENICRSYKGLVFRIYIYINNSSVQFSLVAQSCPTLCNPMNCSTPDFPVHHQLPESTQTHVHWLGDAIQPSHPLSSPSPPAFNLSQHQGLFKWVSSSHQVAKVLEFQLQHQSFQWTPRTDFL